MRSPWRSAESEAELAGARKNSKNCAKPLMRDIVILPMGRGKEQTADAVTTLGAGVDGAVRLLTTAYDTGGRPYLYTSYPDTAGSRMVNQMQQSYNGFGQLVAEWPSHSGFTEYGVNVQYGYSFVASAGRPTHSRLVNLNMPYLFQGGRYDTTTGLYRFRHRDLSPTLGRWLQQDPVGYEAGDMDLYGFERNDPVNHVDPHGQRRKENPPSIKPTCYDIIDLAVRQGKYLTPDNHPNCDQLAKDLSNCMRLQCAKLWGPYRKACCYGSANECQKRTAISCLAYYATFFGDPRGAIKEGQKEFNSCLSEAVKQYGKLPVP